MEKLGSSLKVSDEGFVVGTACWGYLWSIVSLTKMRRACLRLRAKDIRYSCRTAFAVERDILTRDVPSMCVCVYLLNCT